MMRRRSGFALLMAIVLMGVAAMAMAALASLVARDARRTREARADAQLRELLQAGAAAACEQARTEQNRAWDVPLPASLAADGAALKVEFCAGERQTVALVHASADGRRAAQKVVLQKDGMRWRVTKAALEQ